MRGSDVSAAVAIPRITVCPPGPARPELTTEFFDKGHRVTGRAPVSAEFDGSDFSSPGIAFEDYSRMYTQQRKQSGERRLPTPTWSMRPDLTRAVVVHFVERRAGFRNPLPGTERERLEQASKTLAERCGSNEAVLRKLCSHFVELKKANAEPAAITAQKIQIENLDTRLRIDRNIAGIVIRLLHLYYGAGLDSVGVATELGLKPPHVRALVWKLNWVWEKLNGNAKPRSRRRPRPRIARRPSKVDVQKAAQMIAEGRTYREIGLVFGVQGSYVCSALRRAGLWIQQRQRRGRKPKNIAGDSVPEAKEKIERIRKSKIDLNAAAQMRDAGKTYKEIAAFFGVSYRTVGMTLKRKGLWKPGKRGSAIRIRKIDVTVAAQMRDAGKTYKEIGRFFGADKTSVHFALKNAGMWKPRLTIDTGFLIRSFHAGKTTTEIGHSLGITTQMVRYYLRRLGLRRFKPKVDVAVAARMIAKGATYSDIANTLRLPNESRVTRALKRHGLWKPRRKKISVDDLELIARLFHAGKTQDEMAKSLGVPRHIVRLRLKRLSLSRGQGRGRRRSKIDRELAAKMFADGKTYRQIAKFFGVSGENSIAYALKQHGCWYPRWNPRRKR